MQWPTHVTASDIDRCVREHLDLIVEQLADAELMPLDTARGTVAECAGRYCARWSGYMFGQRPEEGQDEG